MVLNKKGQLADFPILTFVVVVIGLLFLAPILFKMVYDPLDKFGGSIASVSQGANESVTHIKDTWVNFWDYVIILALLANILLLLITSFFIDVHPAFIAVYVLLGFFMLFFAPQFLDALTELWTNASYTTAVTNLPLTEFILDNFGIVLVSVFVLSGIIMYGKIRMGANNY